jgi:hypothetical protein
MNNFDNAAQPDEQAMRKMCQLGLVTCKGSTTVGRLSQQNPGNEEEQLSISSFLSAASAFSVVFGLLVEPPQSHKDHKGRTEFTPSS